MIAKLWRALCSICEDLKSQSEARLFLAVWLCLAAAVIAASKLTCFYTQQGTLYGILTEAHGSLIELFCITIVVSLLIRRRFRREWRPSRDIVLARLLAEANRLVNKLLPCSLQKLGGEWYFSFGEAETFANSHYRSLKENDVDLEITLEALKDEERQQCLVAATSEAEVARERIAKFSSLQEFISECHQRLQPLCESARTLADHSIPMDTVSAVARVDYAIWNLLDTLKLFGQSDFSLAWIPVADAKGKLATASLRLLKQLVELSSQSVSFKERIKTLTTKTDKT